MSKICTFLLVAIGLLNLYPAIGLFSAEQVTALYGIDVDSADLETLMRHRAVILGLIGAFLLFAAFLPTLQVPAATIGLVSMSSFIILAYLSGENGALIDRVVTADIFGTAAAAVVLAAAIRERRNAA